MTPLALILASLGLLVSGAHYLRFGQPGWAVFALGLTTLLLATRWGWVRLAAMAGLAGGVGLWILAGGQFIQLRAAMGQPWLRLALILGAVLLVQVAGVVLLSRLPLAQRFFAQRETGAMQAAAFVLTAGLLALTRAKTPMDVLLLDRYLPGWGGAEIFGLAWYAAWLVGRMAHPTEARQLRPKLWAAFSAVFFAQLALGLAGMERMLMTGRLHLPVPALILAGPLFRGEGFFMPILFTVSVLLVGPAWCSHLCYIGAWDDLCRRSAPGKPAPFPTWALRSRWGMLAGVILAALGLRAAGVSVGVAATCAALFGLAGVAVMVLASRRSGRMIHCTAFCPMGLVGNLLGRLAPWRLRIHAACNHCGSCSRVCGYGALEDHDLTRGRPGLSCSLCGDCLGSCPRRHITYTFPGLSPAHARAAFLTLVVSLHAVFMGVARI